MSKCRERGGFTLIELSIVIVIIGLIVAGVVGGQQLVTQAKLRSVVSDVQKYRVAHNAFLAQYGQVAGDITNAHDYWGSSCDSTAANCNGDGDRAISVNSSCNTDTFPSDVEMFRYWQHLQLAGLINTNLTGVGIDGSDKTARPKINIPGLNYNNGGITVRYDVADAGSVVINTNVFFLGKERSTYCAALDSVFSPVEARNIDLKIDDGVSASGVATAGNGTDSGACLSSGAYDLSQTGAQCFMEIVITP